MDEPVLLVHGYSTEGQTPSGKQFEYSDLTKIFGDLPEQLRAEFPGSVQPISLSRYISLDDDLDIDDLAFAFQRALQNSPMTVGEPGGEVTGYRDFNVIIHSTGALVIRNWIRRFSRPGKCPVKRIIHLAGANFGSGWSHIGDSLLAKYGREILSGTERGIQVLSALEFASSFTIDLHRHFLRPGTRMLEDYGVREFCIIGSQVPGAWVLAPIRYGKEDGSDGVVRVSACNLNWNYVRIGPAKRPESIAWKDADGFASKALNGDGIEFDPAGFGGSYYRVIETLTPPTWRGIEDADVAAGRHQSLVFDSFSAVDPSWSGVATTVPFAIPFQCAHSGDEIGVVHGKETRDDVLPLIRTALECDSDADYASAAETYDAVTQRTYARVAKPEHKGFLGELQRGVRNLIEDRDELLRQVLENPKGQYDGHAQVVFRVRDQNGQPVRDFSVHLDSFGNSVMPDEMIDRMFEDQHKNDRTPNTINFYLRVECWEEDRAGGRSWRYRVPDVKGLDLEIDVADIDRDRLVYVPLRMRLPAKELIKYIQPHRTTVFDIELMRLPSDQAFLIRDPMPG